MRAHGLGRDIARSKWTGRVPRGPDHHRPRPARLAARQEQRAGYPPQVLHITTDAERLDVADYRTSQAQATVRDEETASPC